APVTKEPPPPPPPPVVVVMRSRGPSPWIWFTIGASVVGFGALGLGGGEALVTWNDRTKNCGIGGDANACNQAGIDAGKLARTWALVADIGLAVGAVGAIATIVIAAVGRPKIKETRVSVSPFGFSFATTF